MSRFLYATIITFFCGIPLFAQPDLSKPLGPTIADTDSEYYRFETIEMNSEDGERHYKIMIGVPKTNASKNGFPVIYMLDGNAALAAMNDEMFGKLHEKPVIVAIGYDTELRFDVTSRAYDYTPAMPDGSEPDLEASRGRRGGGGADIFAEFIKTRIKPVVEEKVKIDKTRQTLWGHSYGGLFTLNTLFKHTDMFQNYVPVDPSIWWQSGVILDYEKAFAADPSKREVDVFIMVGKGNRDRSNQNTPATSSDDSTAQKVRTARQSVPQGSSKDIAERLKPLVEHVDYKEFEGISHGPMLPTSVEPALNFSIKN